MRLAYLALVPVLAAGCGDDVPDRPTWVADVQPILLANCARCHGDPARGGAPTTFRLDVYQDTTRGSIRVYGAFSIKAFVINRVVKIGDHPPIGPSLDKKQKDILEKWEGDQGMRATNAEPTATLVSPAGALTADAAVTLVIEVDDGDNEPVVGELRLQGGTSPIAVLRNGRQEIVWVSATVAPGTYTLQAHLTDGVATVDRDLGTVTVGHESGNTAPSFEFDTEMLRADQIIGPEGPVPIRWTGSDPDAADVVTVSFEALQGDTVVPLVQTVPLAAGLATIDPAGIPDGSSWRLRAKVNDGTTTTTVDSETFIVSHATTRYGFTDVVDVLGTCAFCHLKNFDPGAPRFAINRFIEMTPPAYPAGEEGFPRYRGRAWRKVVQTREMPPTTLAAFPEIDEVLMQHELNEEERARLGEWLLAGAPEFATAPQKAAETKVARPGAGAIKNRN